MTIHWKLSSDFSLIYSATCHKKKKKCIEKFHLINYLTICFWYQVKNFPFIYERFRHTHLSNICVIQSSIYLVQYKERSRLVTVKYHNTDMLNNLFHRPIKLQSQHKTVEIDVFKDFCWSNTCYISCIVQMSFTCEWQTEEPKQPPSFHLLTNCP